MFVNRNKELQSLNDEYTRKGASFSVIYGRRRVGKTALIEEFIKDKPAIYFYATETMSSLQIEIFSKEIAKFFGLPESFTFKTFLDAFEFLATQKQRFVLVIDEFQNLAKSDSSFSSVLQMAWDMHLSKTDIHLILCGSVLSMMHSHVLNYSSPLYGRRTQNIHLKPISFLYLNEFLPRLDHETLLWVYSAFGGIPKYLLFYDDTLDFYENITKHILDKNSFLYSEGQFLLKQEIHDITTYFSILEVISKGNTKISTIASALSKPATFLTRYLNKLIDLDILQKEIPVTEKNPLKSKFGRYKIKDNFLNFWFFYVYKNYSYLEVEEYQAVLDEIKRNFIDRFVSFVFEDVIKEIILKKPDVFLDFRPTKVGRWWNHKEEIDIVAFDDEHIAFIECKYQTSVNKEKELQKLIKKAFKTDKKAYYVIVTKEDFLRVDMSATAFAKTSLKPNGKG